MTKFEKLHFRIDDVLSKTVGYILRLYIKKSWMKRCREFNKDCPNCILWRASDELLLCGSDAVWLEELPRCDIPPKGWYCTREYGHEGPCAALPY